MSIEQVFVAIFVFESMVKIKVPHAPRFATPPMWTLATREVSREYKAPGRW